jgi:hypothetical protein
MEDGKKDEPPLGHIATKTVEDKVCEHYDNDYGCCRHPSHPSNRCVACVGVRNEGCPLNK